VEDVDASRSQWGTRTLTVDNGVLRYELFPDRGARIVSLVHKPTGKEILWRNPSLDPAQAPAGAFDDCWKGGWDELFPNDEAVTLNGGPYPDHGELWTATWHCEVGSNGEVYLRTECPISKCRVEKWISMADGEERIRFRHRIRNLRDHPLPYLWKLHPALAVSPGDSILIPAGRILLEPEFPGSLGGGPLEWNGPVMALPNRTVDVRMVPPPASREVYFFYGVDLREGWCASYDPARRLAVALSFPKELFTSCWLFASYGGWRDHFVAVLEPSTAFPFRLDQAAASGQCSVLPPNGSQEASVVLATRRGVDGVNRVTADGGIQ
jgi:hypothetical protein